MDDLYKTIREPSEGLFKDKGSRFIARAYPVDSPDQVKDILVSLRKEYHDARHHCYAYRIGQGGTNFRVNDDGEPANSAGKPILGVLQSQELTNVLIVVIRYFGGILLGVGGLINAYRSAARDAVENSEIIEKTFNSTINISFPYIAMNDVMRQVRDSGAVIRSQDFGNACLMAIEIRNRSVTHLLNQLNHIDEVVAQIITL